MKFETNPMDKTQREAEKINRKIDEKTGKLDALPTPVTDFFEAQHAAGQMHAEGDYEGARKLMARANDPEGQEKLERTRAKLASEIDALKGE